MSNLHLRNINKIYPNGFQAVYDFNLDINEGEFIVLVGPSGCGKSTTLRMVAGLEDITKGEFLIEDKLANQLSAREREVAMVFQTYALYPHLSVFDNMAFGLNLEGLDEDLIEEKVLKTAKILGLEEYLDRLPRALSGGQRQRVAVGRAIIRQVDIFLMDEPLSNLDAKQRVTMRAEIIDLHRRIGSTTIYVTHDQTEAMTMADRIVVMNNGYIQQTGTPEELYFHPVNMFVAGFVGEPPMNFIKSFIDNKQLCFTDASNKYDLIERFPLIGLEENKNLYMGFRPEAIVLETVGPNTQGIHMECIVELTELLGDNTNVYGTVGNHDIILKIDPHDTPKIGDVCKFIIPYESLYFFNQETEKVIK